jgi:hypothetical protein
LAWACLFVAALQALPAHAEISFVDMFRNDALVQTADGNSLAAAGSFFALDLNSVNAGDYDSVSATYPGPGSPVSLSVNTPTLFTYQTTAYPTQAAMDADFPFGTYQFLATNAGGSDSTSFDYTADHYSASNPYLAGSSYSDLQNMNPLANLSVGFSPFAVDQAATDAFIFFTVRDNSSQAIVFDAGFLPSTTAGETIPAGTLLPNHSYTYEVIFSDRVSVPSPGAAFDAVLGFDVRTTGVFATVPEASSLVLAMLGGLALLAFRRRRA